MDSYIKLVKGKRFVGSKPVTFSKRTYDPNSSYYITDKLDGERKFLFFTSDHVYIVSQKLEFEETEFKSKASLKNTILDTEFYKGKFYVFDILFYQSKDVRNFKFPYRYSLYKHIVNDLKNPKMKVSEYQKLTCEDFKIHYRRTNNSKRYDGVIFRSDQNYYSSVLKWKPGKLLSIDFKIKKAKNNTFILLTQEGKKYTNKDYTSIGNVQVSKFDYEKYDDNSVVEFVFKKGKFVPLRARPDKQLSNHDRVIASNFEQIINPIDVVGMVC